MQTTKTRPPAATARSLSLQDQHTHTPSLFSSRAAITASSSTGFKEHVEYTILPPSASCSAPRVAIRSCRLREDGRSPQQSRGYRAPTYFVTHRLYKKQTKHFKVANEVNVILHKSRCPFFKKKSTLHFSCSVTFLNSLTSRTYLENFSIKNLQIYSYMWFSMKNINPFLHFTKPVPLNKQN